MFLVKVGSVVLLIRQVEESSRILFSVSLFTL